MIFEQRVTPPCGRGDQRKLSYPTENKNIAIYIREKMLEERQHQT